MSITSVRRRALLCAELCCLVSLGGARLMAQGENATLRQRAVVVQMPAQDSARMQQSERFTDQRVTLELHNVALKGALRAIATQGDVVLFYNDRDIPAERRVSIVVTGATVTQALRVVLRGTGLTARVIAGGIVLERRTTPPQSEEPREQQGAMRGSITDSATGAPVGGATVAVNDGELRTITGADGAYRLASVPVGTITLTVRRLGYVSTSRQVTVVAESETVVNVRLVAAPQMLDEVVTTGTVVPTEVKALPTPISVITAKQLEQQNITKLQDVFRGEVPGMLAWNRGPGNSYTDFASIRGSSNVMGGISTIKTYIDGIEVTDPLYLNMIDPTSIERIEITRGPEASTIYGSGALEGVVQVFTKRGSPAVHPQFSAKVSTGLVQSDWTDAIAQDYALSLGGGGEGFSYQVGGSYDGVGAYLPEGTQRTISSYGALQMTRGKLTLDLSGRYADMNYGASRNPILIQAGYQPWSKPLNEQDEVRQPGVSLRLSYAVSPRWQHNLTIGYDQNQYEYFTTSPRFTTPSDSFVSVTHIGDNRISVAYNTALTVQFSHALDASLILGIDHWTAQDATFEVDEADQSTGTISPAPGSFVYLTRYGYQNTGAFAQTQLTVLASTFLTLGIRAEANGNFGSDYGLSWSPRVGLAHVFDLGSVTVKPRISYGRAIRPPPFGASLGVAGLGYRYLPNPNLGPEQQVGGDGGVDVYVGSRFSFQATHYRQTAIDLIDRAELSSSDPSVVLFQRQNIGRIRNTGWELQGSASVGPLTLGATYTTTQSRVRQLSPSYTGQLAPGDQLLGVPYNFGSASVTYSSHRGTSISLRTTFVGRWLQEDRIALYRSLYGGEPARPSRRDYWMEYPGFAKFNLAASQRLGPQLTAFVQINNLANRIVAERDNLNATAGRWTTLGLRWHP